MRLIVITIVLFLIVTPAIARHSKTDIATIDDGSIFFGEILSVQYATLTLKTDAAGTLNIEWRRITSLISKFEHQVELSDGSRHYGTLEPAESPRHLKIVSTAGTTIEARMANIVQLAPIEHDFWDRINGSLTFGLSYTQTNGALQYNIGYDANYRSRKNYGTFSASSIFNSQKDAESTQQSYMQLCWRRFAKRSGSLLSWRPYSQTQIRVMTYEHY